MANLVLAIGTSHMPGLNNPVERWFTRAESDQHHLELHQLGDYQQLCRDRASWIGPEITEDRIRQRYAACQNAVQTLANVLDQAAPDVIVVVGDDHREVFSAEHIPAFDVHWADQIFVPPFGGRNETGEKVFDNLGENVYPGDASFAEHIIGSLARDQFDVAHSRKLNAFGLGHAFDFVCRRIMLGRKIPMVPVLLNTYYPPNRPTTSRCFALGKALRKALDSWPGDQRVAVIGTGGLTHHIVDQEMDRAVLDAIRKRDVTALTSWPESVFVDGTSEIKAWMVVAGAMAEDPREMELVDYQPCYRSPAGTGCGNAFAYWN